MDRRPFFPIGVEVSVLGIGTAAMGGPVETWGPVDDRESIAAIHLGLDEGINLIETSPDYGAGHAEEVVGKALQSRRREAVIVTQCGFRPGRKRDALGESCLTAESIVRQCNESLRRLRTDYLDLYQCPRPDTATPIEETTGALRRLLDQGKIRAVGVRRFGCEELAAFRAAGPVHFVQSTFSMIHPRAADDLFPYCREHRLGILACGCLAKGLLTRKFKATNRPTDHRAREPDFLGERFQKNLEFVEALADIAAAHGKSTSQLVINWTVSIPGVTAAIVGMKRPSQVLENLGANGWSLSEEHRARIAGLIEETGLR